MNNCLFTVFDNKAEVYSAPFVAPSKAAALRQFLDFAEKEGHPFNAHPADYSLYFLGDFDDATCQITLLREYERLGNAFELLRPSRSVSGEKETSGAR